MINWTIMIMICNHDLIPWCVPQEKEVSADKVIQMLSDNPDKFFERTTTTLGAKASAGNVTSAVITPQQRSDNSEYVILNPFTFFSSRW